MTGVNVCNVSVEPKSERDLFKVLVYAKLIRLPNKSPGKQTEFEYDLANIPVSL